MNIALSSQNSRTCNCFSWFVMHMELSATLNTESMVKQKLNTLENFVVFPDHTHLLFLFDASRYTLTPGVLIRQFNDNEI